jgi:PucR-like helix-turn-helix protein/diguanylate cyclase with GGDEF domain
MMPESRAEALIRQWHEQFRKDPLASKVVAGLRDSSSEIWRHAFDLLQQESPEYRNAVDDEFTEESKAHCGELLRTITLIPTGRIGKRGADPFDFVRTHAKWRAQRQVPLIASLHAYRLAHRTYSEISQQELSRHDRPEDVVRSLTMLSNFWIQIFDHVGAVLAEAHAVEEGLIVAQNTRSYGALIDGLLRGVFPSDSESRKLCARCGIRPGAAMAVAIARPSLSESGRSTDLEVTLRSFVRLIEQALPPTTFGRLVDIRNGEVNVIACRESETARGLVKALQQGGFSKRPGKGHSTRVGVSLDVNDVAHLPRAFDEARTALDFASPARPLMHFAAIDLSDFLVRRADSAAMRLLPSWVTHFQMPDGEQATDFSRTIRAFADCSFNVKRTAQRLGVHTNTVYFRLNRIKKITGVDPRTYSGMTSVLTALRLLEVQGQHGRSIDRHV